MPEKKNIFAIIGSAGEHSANERLIRRIAAWTEDVFQITVFTALKSLPHFDPARSIQNTPEEVAAFRAAIEASDGVIICTPEYVFSIPSGLKNAIEWCVSTTVFSGKPAGLITASAQGLRGHEELQLIMKTVMATFTQETTLLIQGVKAKVDADGSISDDRTKEELRRFVQAFQALVANT